MEPRICSRSWSRRRDRGLSFQLWIQARTSALRARMQRWVPRCSTSRSMVARNFLNSIARCRACSEPCRYRCPRRRRGWMCRLVHGRGGPAPACREASAGSGRSGPAPAPGSSRRCRAPPRRPVESAWGAVPALPSVRFPRPLAEPGVRVSAHRALHGHCRQAVVALAQGLGIVVPR